jgi:hypothetical protein
MSNDPISNRETEDRLRSAGWQPAEPEPVGLCYIARPDGNVDILSASIRATGGTGTISVGDPVTIGSPTGSDCGASTLEQARAPISPAPGRQSPTNYVKPGTWWRNTLDGERRQVLEVHAHGVQLACNSCGTSELYRWSQFLPRFEPAECPPPPVPSARREPVTGRLWVVEAVVGLGPILSGGPGLFELKCIPWGEWPNWEPA